MAAAVFEPGDAAVLLSIQPFPLKLIVTAVRNDVAIGTRAAGIEIGLGKNQQTAEDRSKRDEDCAHSSSARLERYGQRIITVLALVPRLVLDVLLRFHHGDPFDALRQHLQQAADNQPRVRRAEAKMLSEPE